MITSRRRPPGSGRGRGSRMTPWPPSGSPVASPVYLPGSDIRWPDEPSASVRLPSVPALLSCSSNGRTSSAFCTRIRSAASCFREDGQLVDGLVHLQCLSSAQAHAPPDTEMRRRMREVRDPEGLRRLCESVRRHDPAPSAQLECQRNETCRLFWFCERDNFRWYSLTTGARERHYWIRVCLPLRPPIGRGGRVPRPSGELQWTTTGMCWIL